MKSIALSLSLALPAAAFAADALPLRPVTPRGPLDAEETATVSLFKEATGSVVFITNLAMTRDAYWLNETEYPQGAGSGFLWDDQGHVVTNFHVIANADAAEVTLSDHSSYKAKLVGFFADKDIAVLKIDAPKAKLKAIPLGTSKDLQVGQRVYAIGNPFGLDQTLTTGIISALGREIQSMTRRPISGVIQTDAAINPGNSGGPLLDSAGRLIGVNTAIYSPSGASSGVGFAVPADYVAAIVPQLIKHGKVVRPGFGIGIADDNILRRAGLSGVLISDVAAGGAADQAGLLPTRRDRYGRVLLGDVIVAVNGKETADSDDLYRILDTLSVGQNVKVTALRDGRRREFTVRLQAL